MCTFSSFHGNIVMPNPLLGISNVVVTNVLRHHMMDDTVRTTRKQAVEKLVLNFHYVKESDVTDFQTWLTSNGKAADKITYIDAETWFGSITNKPIQFKCIKDVVCSSGLVIRYYDFTIEFEGVKS